MFFGTTNTAEFLRDRTGNRRFWPVDVGRNHRTKSIWEHLTEDEINQLWAEAVIRWRLGENLHLVGEVEADARAVQEEHRETSDMEGLILDFLEKPIPADWSKWSLEKRRMFINGEGNGGDDLVPRNRICALEIWCEVYNGQPKDLPRSTAAEINDTIRNLPGWEKCRVRFGYCGVQRGFQRV